MNNLDEIISEHMGRRVDALVTPENLYRHLKPIIELLDSWDYHYTQIKQAVEQLDERLAAGERPSVALTQAIEGMGEPGKKRVEVWDDRIQL